MQTKTKQTKKALRTTLLVLLLSAAGMGKGYAQSFTSGYLKYSVNGDGVSVTVTGHVNGMNDTVPLVIPDTVTYIGSTYSVISIGNGAFFRYSGHCTVTIPNSVTSIGDDAFYGCNGLPSLTIPNSVTSIGGRAFSGCSDLGQITVAAGNPNYDSRDNCNAIIETSTNTLISGCKNTTIPNSVTSIRDYAFYGCSGMASVTIGNSVTSIGVLAFCQCSSLTSVTIPNSVTSIGRGAFSGCSGMGQITVADGNPNYDSRDNCNAIIETSTNTLISGCKNTVIPNSVTTIEAGAFSGCWGLTSITIPNSVTSIGDHAFSGCSCLTSVTIPNSVTSIGEWAFLGCSGLTSVTIGNSVTSIGDYVFYYCAGLTSVTIGNSVTSIGDHAFSGCSCLTSITIPQSVDTIGGGAFVGCSRLTTVYYNAKKAYVSAAYEDDGVFDYNSCPNLTTVHIGADVQEIGANIFKGCTGVHLVVALGPTPAMVGDAFADFADNSVLVVSCGQRLTYYSMWNKFEFNNIMEDCNEYMVSTSNVGSGGTVTASPAQAQMGQTVTLTVTPNAGMRLSSISVANASDPSQVIPVSPVGKAASNYRFVMPPYSVAVSASFTAGNAVGENSSIAASVYPNPTNGQVRIEAEDLRHITISNMLGQQIFNGSANGNAFEYDFGKHGAGLYLVSIETASGVAVKKVSVVK